MQMSKHGNGLPLPPKAELLTAVAGERNTVPPLAADANGQAWQRPPFAS
jgi:hypothetical protein